MNPVDTSDGIEYLVSERKISYFSEPIENTFILIVPVVCLRQVFKNVKQVDDEAHGLRAIAQLKQGKVIGCDGVIALRADPIEKER